MLEKGHNMSQVGSRERRCVEIFRTDARAAGEEVYIGGWAVIDGKRTMDCRWFSERLTCDNAPWVFTAGEPFRVISSLEMLATLAAGWDCALWPQERCYRFDHMLCGNR